MKKLFLYLLKKYTKSESDRLEVYKVLHSQVCNYYTEQTEFGNVYNSHIEFVIANPFINSLVDDKVYVSMIKSGLEDAYDSAIQHIKHEKLNKIRSLKIKRLLK